jgi:hypothetical protein
MSDPDDVYIRPSDYRPNARIPKLEPLHRAHRLTPRGINNWIQLFTRLWLG